MDDHTEKDLSVRRFAKGDKVLAPWISRTMPLAEVVDVYENAERNQVLLVRHIAHPESSYFYHAEHIEYVGDRKFLVIEGNIYSVSNGEVVAQSKLWANAIADFLETFTPLFSSEAENDSPVTHDVWSALNE
jgi:hypothetical protein